MEKHEAVTSCQPGKLKTDHTIWLNTEKFEFLIQALHQLTTPLAGKEQFRVMIEKNPECPGICVTYEFSV